LLKKTNIMKYLVLIFICFSFSAFSQDVIMKKDGKKIDAKVVEITTTMIKYRSWEQQDGPIRNIAIKDVKEIIYDDGTWDNFEDHKVEEPKETDPIRVDTREKEVEIEADGPENDKVMKSGFFMELLPGVAMRNGEESYTVTEYDPITGNYITSQITEQTRDIYGAITLRFGSKWYFGAREKWRPGIQATWLRLGIYLNGDNNQFPINIFSDPKSFSIVNVGMTNVFKFGENVGMEANLTSGFNIDLDLYDGEATAGLGITPEVKFRYKKLAFGLDYMHVFGLDGPLNPKDWNVFSFSIGAKF